MEYSSSINFGSSFIDPSDPNAHLAVFNGPSFSNTLREFAHELQHCMLPYEVESVLKITLRKGSKMGAARITLSAQCQSATYSARCVFLATHCSPRLLCLCVCFCGVQRACRSPFRASTR